MPATRPSVFTKLFRRAPSPARCPKPAARTRLGLTALEARENPSVTLYNGDLYVYGTNGPDNLTVQSLAVPRITGGADLVVRVTENGVVTDKPRAAVTGKIYAYGLGGADRISVTSPIPAVVDGGAGNDTLYGGSGSDVFYGGAGANSYPNAERQDRIIDPVLTGNRAMGPAVMADYQSLGGSAGYLGLPTEDQQTSGRFDWVHFQGGAVVATPTTGAHAIGRAVLAKYEALGGGGGMLGAPLEDQKSGAGMQWSHFEGGVIISSGYGAFTLRGPVLAKYEALGGGGGFLGAPTEDVQSGAGMEWCHFQKGTERGAIVSSVAGAFEVHGAILAKYEAMGGGGGPLGAPTTDEVSVPGGKYSAFQNGRLYWSASTGVIVDAVTLRGVPGGDPQTDDWSCGPNSVSRVLRYYGYTDATYSAVRARDIYHGDLVTRVKMGSSPGTLLGVMQHWKADSRLVLRSNMGDGMEPIFAALAKGRPVVALVNPTGRSSTVPGGHLPESLHWVVVTGFDRVKGEFYVTNTNGRAETWSLGDFYQRWNWSATGPVGDFLTGSLGVKERTIIF